MPPRKTKATEPKEAVKNTMPKSEPCTYHPPNRIIGGVCMACGNTVPAKK